MAQQVPTVGTLSYSGESFSGYTRTTAVSIRPEMSSDGRSVKWNSWSLSFESTITGDNKAAIDNTATRLRRVLTKNGGPFILTDRAIGDVRVNVGNIRDVENGPKPKEVSFEAAAGGNLAAKLRWSIDFKIPECPDAKYRFAALDFAYTVTYSYTNGYLTRSVRGKLSVPQNRFTNGQRLSQDSADSYRELIVGDPPEGFRLRDGGGTFTLSEDRGTLNFEYAHVEMGRNVLPPGLIEWNASQTWNSSTAYLNTWQTTITADGEVAKNGQTRDAVRAFVGMVLARIESAQQQPAADPLNPNQKMALIPVAFTASEPAIFGPRKFSFSMTFTTAGSVQSVFNSGLWQQLPGQNRNSWRLWYTSLKDTALHPRGYSKLVFDIGDDPVVDLCGGKVQVARDRRIGPRPQNVELANDAARLIQQAVANPPPESSWIHYECNVIVQSDSGNALVRQMPVNELKADSFPDQGFDVGAVLTAGLRRVTAGVFNLATGGGGVGNNRPAPFIGGKLDNAMAPKGVQGRGPAWVVIIDGCAVRAWHQIPRPSLKSINDRPLIPLDRLDAGEGFGQHQVAVMGEVPVFLARWRMRYGVEGDIGQVPVTVPRNILLGG